ncbi:hypothetical protein DHEL01_v201779 [Diaporthe helianthi]|uniref:Uncharacterized protein n=1 Tax=Diaporthe helianthi TaxID=158607 RepID=A0A2P5IBF6_DIAHE|nr:hypothetical protein DHEL01_v201779 [Diaporthe helianthi]
MLQFLTADIVPPDIDAQPAACAKKTAWACDDVAPDRLLRGFRSEQGAGVVPPSCSLPRARQSIVSLSISAPLMKILERHRLVVGTCQRVGRYMPGGGPSHGAPVGLVPHSRLLVTAARGRGRDDHPRVRTADP